MVRPELPAIPSGPEGTTRHGYRLGPIGGLAAGFLLSSTLVFAVLLGVGRAFGVALLPQAGRLAAAAGLLVVLCVVEIAALRARTLCRLSWRRQTPKNLIYRYGPVRGPVLWGVDTGLTVTTFRVSAATWAALGLVLLQLAPAWTGLAYGLGFVLPLAVAAVLPGWRERLADGTEREPHWIAVALSQRRWVPQTVNLVVMVGLLGLLVAALP